MLYDLGLLVPVEASKIGLVLLLSFLTGLEREEHKQQETHYAFGGIRTFPLIGLFSYGLALISGPEMLAWAVGLLVVGGFLLFSYRHKLAGDEHAGMTTELSGLATYLVGALVHREHYWLASTVAIAAVLLLELKKGLEGLTARVAPGEIVTFAKFLVLTVVILPVLPDRDLTRFHLNPFKMWLVVVAVSGVSFGSYVLQRLLRGRGGVFLSAILGGAYSSTVTTVVLARQAREAGEPRLYAGSILAASGMMYVRLVLLLAFFDLPLARRLAPAFAVGAVLAGGAGWILSGGRRARAAPAEGGPSKNPLELGAAAVFALVFVLALILTGLARDYLGRTGLYTLAAVMGVTDVDPFILGLTQAHVAVMPLQIAASSIVIAAASNNVVKGIYAYVLADRDTGRLSLALLLGLAVVGLAPLAWV